MTATLIPTRSASCPLCGLRFASRPMLELHVREDHPRAAAVPRQARGARRDGGQRPGPEPAGSGDGRR